MPRKICYETAWILPNLYNLQTVLKTAQVLCYSTCSETGSGNGFYDAGMNWDANVCQGLFLWEKNYIWWPKLEIPFS